MSGEGWWNGKGEEKGVREDGRKGEGERRGRKKREGKRESVCLNVVDANVFRDTILTFDSANEIQESIL